MSSFGAGSIVSMSRAEGGVNLRYVAYLCLDIEWHVGQGDALNEAAGGRAHELPTSTTVEPRLLDTRHHLHHLGRNAGQDMQRQLLQIVAAWIGLNMGHKYACV